MVSAGSSNRVKAADVTCNHNFLHMKQKLTLIFFLSFTFGLSQVSPEDLIIVYDSTNPKGKISLKSNLSNNLDSINIHLLEDKKIELLTKKDNLIIRTHIIGDWTLKSVERTNGIPYNLSVCEKIRFKKNGEFTIIENGKVIKGKWKINTGEITLNYNEPYCQIKDKYILDLLTKEQIKSVTYSSNILHIKEIDDKSIVFMHFLPENPENIDDMFYFLVQSIYIKGE